MDKEMKIKESEVEDRNVLEREGSGGEERRMKRVKKNGKGGREHARKWRRENHGKRIERQRGRREKR